MEVSLQPVEDINFPKSERAIFNVLKATLQYPADSWVKGAKLADDIGFFCKSVEGGADVDEVLWEVWSVVIEIVCYIPPGHAWQDSLIRSLEKLRQRDDAISEYNKSMFWKDLPNLSFCVREKWSDPTYTGEVLTVELEKCMNLHSFVARLTSNDFAPWLNLPIWQLRIALEEPVVNGSAMECRIWVASEWIIHCADIIFKDMNSGMKEKLDESTAQSLRTGPLCDDISPLSVERWKFWKKRFSELAADASNLGLESAITGRISEALESMDNVKQ